MKPDPWALHGHPAVWAALVVGGSVYLWLVHWPAWRASRRQQVQFFVGLAMTALATTWPVGDLAERWSLTLLVFQRLVLLLGVPPLLELGLPRSLVAAATRPASIDRLASICTRPLVAVAIVTATGVGTLVIPVVDAAASSMAARVAVDAVLLVAGLVLWAPVLELLPGTRRLSPLGKAAYLVVQSLLPGFFSVVWIFARHPLYHAFNQRFMSFSPEGDQQVAGFAAKLGTIAVMWTVAALVVARSERRGVPADTRLGELHWVDVQRDLERLERRDGRRAVRPGAPADRAGSSRRSAWLPPPSTPLSNDSSAVADPQSSSATESDSDASTDGC